jgi:hypothetical protein
VERPFHGLLPLEQVPRLRSGRRGSVEQRGLGPELHPHLAAARDQHHRAGDDAFIDILRGRLFDLLSWAEERPTYSGFAIGTGISARAVPATRTNASMSSMRLKPFMCVSPD